MPKAAELLRQGRVSELWQMTCGYTNLTLEQFYPVEKVEQYLVWQVQDFPKNLLV